jgi:hypothetical protein
LETWLGLGLFLIGAGAGALLTAIRYSAEIGRLRVEIQSVGNYRQQDERKTQSIGRSA